MHLPLSCGAAVQYATANSKISREYFIAEMQAEFPTNAQTIYPATRTDIWAKFV